MFLPAAVSAGLWLTAAPVGATAATGDGGAAAHPAAVLTALSSGAVLAVAALLVLARLPAVAVVGRLVGGHGRGAGPGPRRGRCRCRRRGARTARLGRTAVASAGRDLALAARTCRRLGPGAGGLVVVDDPAPDAYALPGLSGRVVVSTAMLRALPAAERRALLAHEAGAPAPPPPPARPAGRAGRRGQPAAAPAGGRGARRGRALGRRGRGRRAAGPRPGRPGAGQSRPGPGPRRPRPRSPPPARCWVRSTRRRPSAPAPCWHRGRPGVGGWRPPWSR